MRVVNIEFRGYRRLRDVRCNTDGKLIAFLGPNEAGKSSVLGALDWFSNGQGPLPTTDRYRPNKPKDDADIVVVKYRLTDDDHEAIKELSLVVGTTPESITVARTAGGRTRLAGWQPAVTRDSAPFNAACTSLDAVRSYLGENEGLAETVDAFATVVELSQTAQQILLRPEEDWSEDAAADLTHLGVLLRSVYATSDEVDAGTTEPALDLFHSAAEALDRAMSVHAHDHPRKAIARLLMDRRPAFLLFSNADRDLKPTYNLNDDTLRADPPAALRNLLAVAGTTTDELWTVMGSGDRTAFRSLESSINDRLRSRIVTSWRQSELTLSTVLNTDGQLEVLIEELDTLQSGSPRVDFGERSDGLRTFMALNCFLGARDRSLPPVLLIDEAETHLHYDAQADLLALLLQDAELGQVFYTTHSPGCLPPDLGTGLRFVARSTSDPRDSVLENSFWANATPGFSRLLFAMGAGAAAFSRFRRAVICEGASEMILLPTLLRLAVRNAAIDFQVAPGLSNANSADPALREIAVDTVFLVDGDAAGDERRESLKASGYNEKHILQLPPGHAVEDLLDRDSYLDVIDMLIRESGQSSPIDRSALDPSVTVAKAVDLWGQHANVKTPGHVAVAARLIAEPEKLIPSAPGLNTLQALYVDIKASLERSPR